MGLRILEIVVRESYRDHASVSKVYIFHLPTHDFDIGRHIEEDELPKKLRSLINTAGPINQYSLHEHRYEEEDGAGDSGQTVILTIGEALLSGTVEAVIGTLVAWAIHEIKTKERGYPSTLSIDEHISVIKELVSKQFRVIGNLAVIEAELLDTTVTVVLRDSVGTKFKAVARDNNQYKFEKLRD